MNKKTRQMLGFLLLAVGGYLIYKELTRKRAVETPPMTRPQFVQEVNPDGMAIGIRVPDAPSQEIIVR
tara:strand:+ start:14624 stop:14827 length:204 start_codon:yes stop_codon:yes gene_type:complete